MKKNFNDLLSRFSMFFIFALFGALPTLFANESSLEPYVESVEQAEQGMTLWQIISAGGWVMVVLAILSMVMITLIVYLFMSLQITKLVPMDFSHAVINNLKAQRMKAVQEACETNDNIISRIVRNGLEKKDDGISSTKEVVEMTARKETTSLWASLSYLSDIASVAPMVGLLGTVIGMIEAFNAIAFQTAVVKPILLAGGVSKAMVTTAAGMIIAIIAMIFYSVFRFKIQNITNAVESLTNEILDSFTNIISKKGKDQ